MKSMIGTVIAKRYEIREHIASGGMASVYKAWDSRVDRVVAVKALHSLDRKTPQAVERFRREARTAAALTHPNAVTIFDFVEEPELGHYFLVMEYIAGPTLKQVITERRQLQPREAITIATQVCSVLQVAHAQGFIHRDIKPQNIMIAASGKFNGILVKLADFGIVRLVAQAGLTNTGIVLGTADYLSPEQARGQTLTPASDLYSLGVVVYEMLAGRPPYGGPTAVSIALQHATASPPPLRRFNPYLPPALEHIVMRSLAKEEKERFHSAFQFQQALQLCEKELGREEKRPPLAKLRLGART